MKSGDIVELAIWLDGKETEQELEHWKSVVCPAAMLDTGRQNGFEMGPPEFAIKRPGEDRVPQVPDHISGPDVRLLIAESKVGRPVQIREIVPGTGFTLELTSDDLEKLRQATRRAHARHRPWEQLSDQQCDHIIEKMGPETALKTLRDQARIH